MIACYIRNGCPTGANEGVAPIARWKNGVNNIDHLRVFGRKAWAANKFRLSKLSSKGMSCIFIGYDENAKAYRFYDDVKDKFFISRDVKFAEDVFPMRQQDDARLLNWKLTRNIVIDGTKEVSIPIPTEEGLDFLGNQNHKKDDLNISQQIENEEENKENVKEVDISKKTKSGRTIRNPIWPKPI
ncbi:hypothetical protein QE152_g27847 [Popillia japonica]|uniref:Retroviral polymerase SH3-like domain-containing protein n=1 Tax=Popillia japonica TaxID=7064 RepID=A0AAW1JLE6_POPJA